MQTSSEKPCSNWTKQLEEMQQIAKSLAGTYRMNENDGSTWIDVSPSAMSSKCSSCTEKYVGLKIENAGGEYFFNANPQHFGGPDYKIQLPGSPRWWHLTVYRRWYGDCTSDVNVSIHCHDIDPSSPQHLFDWLTEHLYLHD